MELLQDMGERFRIKRELKGYTRRDVAVFTGLAVQDVLALENGLSITPYAILDCMCRSIGTTAHDLLSVYRWTYTEAKKEDSSYDAA